MFHKPSRSSLQKLTLTLLSRLWRREVVCLWLVSSPTRTYCSGLDTSVNLCAIVVRGTPPVLRKEAKHDCQHRRQLSDLLEYTEDVVEGTCTSDL